MPMPEIVDRALLYARTARHLRPVQWIYWPLRRAQRRLPARLAQLAGELDPDACPRMAATVSEWGPGCAERRLQRAEAVLGGSFRFLNHAETLGQIHWGRRYVGHLWNYHLHYFDYALDLAWAYRLTQEERFVQRFEALAESWIAGTRPGVGDGWEPYPLSLRIVNWTYALLLCGEALAPRFRERLAASLFSQADFLGRRLELHLLANHLQKNLKALLVAGLLFRGPRAGRWRERGARGLWRELREQVLADGGHFERSPMYHAIALGDYLEVVALLHAVGEPVPQAERERIQRMARALGVLSRPDGTLHLFNDAADGIAPARSELSRLAGSILGEGIVDPAGAFALPQTGYYGWVDPGSGVRLLIDCGTPGPEYQPAHAHCDLLSFELDLGGHPVVVDSGVCGYADDPLREYVRSTRAHNTVMIGGHEQSEVWGTFRLARRARVVSAQQSAADSADYRFSGACAPYHDRRAVHRRSVERRGEEWIVTDRVEGAAQAPLSSFLHLHPDYQVERSEGGVVARAGAQRVGIEAFGIDRLELRIGERDPAQGWYCPQFGTALPAPVLEMRIEGNRGSDFGYRIWRLDR